MSERKQFGILQKVIYIADQSDVCHNICEYLDGEYQVIYKSISKALKTSQMLRNIYALYIIEMTNFTQTSETLINKIRQNSNSPIFLFLKLIYWRSKSARRFMHLKVVQMIILVFR
jgi:hypothetical protein